MGENVVKTIFREIATGVAYIHELGLVHRDLRIENVMLDDQASNVKIIDFGCATSFQPNDKLAMIGGTPQYKNAYTIKNKTMIGQGQDIYQMGIMLYTMLTGGVPAWAHHDADIFPSI